MKFNNDYYIIDKEYRLVAFNDTVKERYSGIKIGDLCYKATMNRETPCLHCPIAGNADNECPIYFDPYYNDWVQANFSDMGDGLYGVICHLADQTAIDFLSARDNERIKKALSGKSANSILHKQIVEQNGIIEGLSGVYYLLLLIDLETRLYRRLCIDEDAINYESSERGQIATGFELFANEQVAIESRTIFRQFVDIDTIPDRLGSKSSIYQEFIGTKKGWSKAGLIPAARDTEGRVTKVMFSAELINDELTDPLTGCNNRRALEWVRHKNNDRNVSIAVVMCDINGLKKQNDNEGHDSGDVLICRAADKMFEYFGRNKVYRVGGDEFVIVDVNVNKDAFSEKVLRFKKSCEINNITLSIGYKYEDRFNLPFDRILEMADQRMYEAKREYYRRNGFDRRDESEISRHGDYMDSLIDYGSYAYIACEMNLSNNTYRLLHAMEGYDTSFIKECETLEALFDYPLKKQLIHPEDITDYVNNVNIQTIKGISDKNGRRSENWVRFRSNLNRKEYHLIEVSYFAGREYTEENQVGYFFVKDMGMPNGSNKFMFEEILKELSENFESIYYVDFDEDEVIPYRMSSSIIKKQGSLLNKRPTYADAIGTYIENSVCEADKAAMLRVCDKDYLTVQLRTKRAFSHDFTTIIDGEEVLYRIKFSNMDGAGELHHCIVGFTNINSEGALRREFDRPGNTLLIVEEDKINMEILANMLSDEYNLLKAKDGIEALEILRFNYKEIALILTDLMMDKMNGFEFIGKVLENRRFATIPIVVQTAFDDELNKQKCYDMGATDIISKPYSEAEIKNRIRGLVRLRGVTATLNKIEIDELTGLYTKEAFFRYAQIMIDNNPEKEFVILVSDIVGFKAINEQYGKEIGDSILRYLAEAGNDGTNFSIGGRLGSDIFASIGPETDISPVAMIEDSQKVLVSAPVPNLVVKFGIYSTRLGRSLTVRQMCDRAEMAMYSIKDKYNVYCAFYDDSMRDRLLIEQFINDSMKPALKEGQFSVFFQPKHNISDESIAGAEALVRWTHPELGFMSPNDFIPLFERNGFITELDKYVWEKTCEEISALLDKGRVVPISVNVSRRDFSDPNLADYFVNLADKYMIPHELLQIEVTETAYSDNPKVLRSTITKLHNSGFVIELDDFGTGYSSITALNSMDIDYLKLDMSIIREDKNESGKSALEFIMSLANMMELSVIQEGVETKEQLERVKSLGCEYVQGYYFSKPLSRDDFEKYVAAHN